MRRVIRCSLARSILQEYEPLGLRIVHTSLTLSSADWATLEELLALFRTLKQHPRMKFLVIVGVSTRTQDKVMTDVFDEIAPGDVFLGIFRKQTKQASQLEIYNPALIAMPSEASSVSCWTPSCSRALP